MSDIFQVRTKGPRGLLEIIRSEARLAQGNSDGPLVDTASRVIGLNSMIVGGDQGMGIPAGRSAASSSDR